MDVPILGQPRPTAQPGYAPVDAHNQSDLTQGFQLYDHEIVAVEKVALKLRERAGLPRTLDDFDREIRQRYEDIGLVVKVNWWSTNVEGTFMPEVEVVGRTEKHEFDHDEMVHEVTNDLLGLGTEGVIKSDKVLRPEKHKH